MPGDGERATLYTFNKFFAEFVMGLKKVHPGVKGALGHYRVMENLSTLTDNVDHFCRSVIDRPEVMRFLKEEAGTASTHALSSCSPAFDALEPVKGISIGEIRRILENDNYNEESISKAQWSALGYVYILLILYDLYKNPETDDQQQLQQQQTGDTNTDVVDDDDKQTKQELPSKLRQTLNVITKVRSGRVDKYRTLQELLDGEDVQLLDDDYVAFFEKLFLCEKNTRSSSSAHESSSDSTDPNDFMKSFENSKIGMLAGEMIKELDIAKMLENSNSNNPMDLFNMANLLNPQSDAGGMLVKMAHLMQNKMNSGELRMEELFGEVTGMVNSNDAMKNNPLISTLLKSVQQQHYSAGSTGTAPNAPGNAEGSSEGDTTASSTESTGSSDLVEQLLAKMGGLGGLGGAAASIASGMQQPQQSQQPAEDTEHLEQMFAKLGRLQQQAAQASSSSRTSRHHLPGGHGGGSRNGGGGSSSSTQERLRKVLESRQKSNGGTGHK